MPRGGSETTHTPRFNCHHSERTPRRRRAWCGLWLTFGFLDEPDVPASLALLPPAWLEHATRTSYILGRQILVPAARPGMPKWQETLFAAMVRLSGSATEYFRLPPGLVVELGSQIEI